MSEAPGTSQVGISRAWRYDGEDESILHIELAAADETLHVNLRAGRNPRMFEFITKHATITTEARPAKEPKSAQ